MSAVIDVLDDVAEPTVRRPGMILAIVGAARLLAEQGSLAKQASGLVLGRG
jgi:hypothetical protein